MWKNIDTEENFYNSHEIQISKLKPENDSSFFFPSNDQTNPSKNLVSIESNQNPCSYIETESIFGDDPLGFSKDISKKSVFANGDFDFIDNTRDNQNRLNDIMPGLNNNNNNNNNFFQSVPLKTSKRGRGRGSRGSYKPRGSNRSRMVNQNFNYGHCSYNSSMQNCVYPCGSKFNLNHSGTFISQPQISNSPQTVCINPEILRRLGYQQTNSNENNSLMILNMKNQSVLPKNQINDYGYLWNNQLNEINKLNENTYDYSFLNNNETNFEDTFPSNCSNLGCNDSNFDLFKSNVEDINYFGDFDSRCYLNITNKEHLTTNREEHDSTNLNDDSNNLDSFF